MKWYTTFVEAVIFIGVQGSGKSTCYREQFFDRYVQTTLADALRRNAGRTGKQQIPPSGVVSTYKHLQEPTLAEGFDQLHVVTIDDGNRFVVSP